MVRRETMHDKFQTAFDKNLFKNTPRQAFDKTEELFKSQFGHSPYSGFDSFRVSSLTRHKSKNQKGRR